MTRLLRSLLVAALVAVAATALAAAPARAAATPDEYDFLDLANQERASEGLAPLQMVPSLHDLAEDWSEQQSARRTLAHRPGADQAHWVEHRVTPNWRRIGENVGSGYSVRSLHDAFMDSPGHRANVLGPYTHVGIGAVVDPDGRIWVTVNFLDTPDRIDVAGVPAPAPAPAPPALGDTTRFHPVTPQRLVDTRRTDGDKPGPGTTVDIAVVGAGGLPADADRVAAVALNVTVVEAEGAGFVTVWPTGAARPLASNLNPQRPGQIVANQVLVPVGEDGRVSLYASSPTHVVVDVTGWFEPADRAAAGRFVDVTPSRLLDTRDEGDAVDAGTTTIVPVTGRGGVPTAGVGAVSVNVTVTRSAGTGFLTVWGDGRRPVASALNTDSAGQTIANQVFVPVGADGTIRLFNSMDAHLIVDVTGWFTDESADVDAAGLFVPVSPYRAVDTRDDAVRSRVAATWDLDLQGRGWRAAALNVTIVDAADSGYVTVWGGGNRPPTSTVNADRARQTIPNAATVNGAGDSSIRVFTNQETHLIIDVNGFYVA